MNRGFVYILVNDAMPGLVKIGMTTATPELRAKQLSDGTAVPFPFVVAHSVLSPDCAALELKVHEQLAEFRISQSREFFTMSSIDAGNVLDEFHEDQIGDFAFEFLETHKLVNELELVDPSTVSIIAIRAGVAPPDVDMLLQQLTDEALQSAAERLSEVYARRRLNRQMKSEAIDLSKLPECLQ